MLITLGWFTEHGQPFDALATGFHPRLPDLATFLPAALLLPRFLTADLNFPQWHYFGRGLRHSQTTTHTARPDFAVSANRNCPRANSPGEREGGNGLALAGAAYGSGFRP